MIQVGLCDINFAHVFSSSGWNTPKYFNWNRTDSNPVCFFTDYCLSEAPKSKAIKKIALLLEPPAIYPASYDYVRSGLGRFDYVLTYDRSLVNDRNVLFYPHGGCWIPGPGDQRNRSHMVDIHQKKHLVSVIASGKSQTVGHRLRHAIVQRFAQITAFGPQYKPLEFKEDALVDYMFSIAVENSICDDYFTEKLIDCFATGTIPIYWGTDNITKYFNGGGILRFNSLDTLDDIISKLSPELYNSRIHCVQDNFNKHDQYRIAEDWIFEQYPHLFRT